MVIQRVSYAGILNAPNVNELLDEYAAECSIPEIGTINPQEELYARMEQSGNFQVFGAFDGNKLAGFAAILAYLNPHYGRQIATVESLFLGAGHRTSRTGNDLMNAIEAWAKERGCEAILYSARTGSHFEKLLSLMKPYQRTNAVFLRRLLK